MTLEEIEKTYLTKEEFLLILQNINFSRIEKADISFITSLEYDKEQGKASPRGFDLNIC